MKAIINTVGEAMEAKMNMSFPIKLSAAYCLKDSGHKVVKNEDELQDEVEWLLTLSPTTEVRMEEI